MLVAFCFVGYVQRTSVAIAAERMMPTLGLSQVQVGLAPYSVSRRVYGFSSPHSWPIVFATGAVLSVVAAALWIWIDVAGSSETPETAASARGGLAASDALQRL